MVTVIDELHEGKFKGLRGEFEGETVSLVKTLCTITITVWGSVVVKALRY